jgi:hypothetical protein
MLEQNQLKFKDSQQSRENMSTEAAEEIAIQWILLVLFLLIVQKWKRLLLCFFMRETF